MNSLSLRNITLIAACITAYQMCAHDARSIKEKLMHTYTTISDFVATHQDISSAAHDSADIARLFHKTVRKALNWILNDKTFVWYNNPESAKTMHVLSLIYVSFKEKDNLDEQTFENTFGLAYSNLSQKTFSDAEITKIGQDPAVRPLLQDSEEILKLCTEWLQQK
jgi:hypothetical protein